MALYQNINGWAKESLPGTPNAFTYYGNNMTIRVTKNRYILLVDADRDRIDALETSEERLARTIDFDSLSTPNKESQANAVALVEFWITENRFPTQTINTSGDSGGGGNVTVIANDTDFSTETTLSSLLDAIIELQDTGVPVKATQGVTFGISSKEDNVLSGIPTGQDHCAYLFCAKAGTSIVTLRSFFLSFESTSNDEYEIRLSVNPVFSNWTPQESNYIDITDVSNPVQSKMKVAIAGENGVPNNPVISSYNQPIGGRFLLGKRAEGNEIVDSRVGFELAVPEGFCFAVSILATSNGAAVKASVNWNE